MKLTCDNCQAEYEVDASLIPEKGREVECSRCENLWTAFPTVEPSNLADQDKPVSEVLADVNHEDEIVNEKLASVFKKQRPLDRIDGTVGDFSDDEAFVADAVAKMSDKLYEEKAREAVETVSVSDIQINAQVIEDTSGEAADELMDFDDHHETDDDAEIEIGNELEEIGEVPRESGDRVEGEKDVGLGGDDYEVVEGKPKEAATQPTDFDDRIAYLRRAEPDDIEDDQNTETKQHEASIAAKDIGSVQVQKKSPWSTFWWGIAFILVMALILWLVYYFSHDLARLIPQAAPYLDFYREGFDLMWASVREYASATYLNPS